MNPTTTLLSALGAAAALLLAACAATTPPPQEKPAAPEPVNTEPARPEEPPPPAANANRAPRGSEIQTPLADYTRDDAAEYRVLGQGEGDADADASDAARKNARERMERRIREWTERVGASGLARRHAENALTRALRESEPDLWEYDDGRSPRFKAYFGVSLEKSLVEKTLRELAEKAREGKRLPAPLDAVPVENARFPATISGMRNVFKEAAGRNVEIAITPEIPGTLTIFCYNKAGEAVVVGFETGERTRCALRAGEAHKRRLSFSVEDPAALREEGVLLFVLTQGEIPFDARPGEVFPCARIAEWLSKIPPRERFVEALSFAVER